MTANTPLQPQERRASRDSRQGTGYRIRAPSYLYHAVPCSVPRWSHARAHTSGTSHPLNTRMPESQMRGRHARARGTTLMSALDISGGPKPSVCTVPLTCVRLGGSSPHASMPCTPDHTPCTPDHTCSSSVHITRITRGGWLVGWLLIHIALLPLLLYARWATCAGRHAPHAG